MSYFRNVENDGVWEKGGTYTFEVNEQSTQTDPHHDIPSETPVYTGYWECYYGGQRHFLIGEEPTDPPPPYWLQETNPNPYPHPFDRPVYKYSGYTCESSGQFAIVGFGVYNNFDSLLNDVCGNIALPHTKTLGESILFNNNSENYSGIISGSEITKLETLEDGWTKYTIKISENTKADEYYIKGREYDQSGMIS